VTVTPDPRTLKTIGQLSTIGLAFVFALMMGFGAGYWLDTRLGTKPWLSLIGFAMGLAAGILNVVRTMKAVSAGERALQEDRDRAAGPGQP
jgi:ATP synthase protein I